MCLPKNVQALLSNPPAHSIAPFTELNHNCTSLLVADSGATNHMLPSKSAIISYYPVEVRRVCMGNNSIAPILGHGTAFVSVNGKKILIQICLHVPDLRNPLYSLRAHQRQRGRGFIGMFGLRMYVFFLMFIPKVDITTDCHLQYAPFGWTTTLADLDYVQPKFL
jgi:hypothetical protein